MPVPHQRSIAMIKHKQVRTDEICRPAYRQVFNNTAHYISTQNPQEPVYLFCPDALIKQSHRIQAGFPGVVAYAVKANPRAEILSTLWSSGVDTFDVASIEEIKLVLNHLPHAILNFNNPVKSSHAIYQAWTLYGVKSFVIDDQAEFEKIKSIVGKSNQLEVSVRFNIPYNKAAYDFTNKFGATEDEAVNLLKRIKEQGYKTALTFHPGSQCSDPTAYEHYIHAAARITKKAKIRIDRLNTGGGFPVRYRENPAPPLRAFFSAIQCSFKQCFSDTDTKLICEPGRSMVAQCCSLLTRVIHRRQDKRTLFLNDGVYGGLMEQMLIPLKPPVITWRGKQQLTRNTKTFVIFGPTCDSLDKLPGLPLSDDINEGDFIEFGCLGAYGSSTATHFNGFQSEIYKMVLKTSRFFNF